MSDTRSGDRDVRFSGAVLVLVIFLALPASAQTSLQYGDCIQGAISVNGEVDSCSFDGSAGDVVTIWMPASWDTGPQLELYSPAGGLLQRVSGNFLVGWSTTRIDGYTLPTSGSYRIRAMDAFGAKTGTYGLFLQRTFTPLQSKAVTYGETVQDTVSQRAEMNAYTFAASAGDVVTVNVAASWGSGPQVELYSPAGALLQRVNGNPVVGWSSVRIDAITLTTTGSYTILAMDFKGQIAGNYGLSLQRTFNPAEGRGVSYGATVQDTVFERAGMNAYTFPGIAGDVVTITMNANWITGPQLELYSPAGALLQRVFGNSVVGWSSTGINAFTLASSGSYTILAMDWKGQKTGLYSLQLQGIPYFTTSTLNAGWNLVSVPRAPSNNSAHVLFSGALPGSIWGALPGIYTRADTLAPGQGYWGYFSSGGDNMVIGAAVTSCSAVVPDGNRWVLVGGPTSSVPVANLISTPPACIVPGTVYGLGTTGYSHPTTMDPMKGYWVFVNAPCTLTISQ